MLTLSKPTSHQKPFDYDCITLYVVHISIFQLYICKYACTKTKIFDGDHGKAYIGELCSPYPGGVTSAYRGQIHVERKHQNMYTCKIL